MQKIKQKLIGIILIVIGIVPLAIAKDATVAVFLVPLGAFFLFTHADVLNYCDEGGRYDD